MLAGFTPVGMQQGDLFVVEQQSPCSEALMQVIDRINQGEWGRSSSRPEAGIPGSG